MQMRTGGASGRADPADHLADADALTDLDVDLGQVAVACRKTVAVVDLHHVAVAAVPAGDGHAPVGRGAHRLAIVAAQIDAGMHGRPSEEGVGANAEGRTHVDGPFDRLADGDGRQRARVAVDGGPREIDAVKLPFEGAGVAMRRLRSEER